MSQSVPSTRTAAQTGTSETEAVSTAVVQAIADERGVDVLDLSFCLADYVDPDALDVIADDGNGVREVALRIDGLQVVVRSADAIEVTPVGHGTAVGTEGQA